MTDWASVPVFGVPAAGVTETIRPSAYGIISDTAGRIAVVRTPLGVFLPGGGSDEGESPEATVVRETREECGLAVDVGPWRRAAIEHGYSVTEQTHFEKRSTFCSAVVVAPRVQPSELDHVLEWMTPTEASVGLTSASHRWAVSEWMASGGLVASRAAGLPAT